MSRLIFLADPPQLNHAVTLVPPFAPPCSIIHLCVLILVAGQVWVSSRGNIILICMVTKWVVCLNFGNEAAAGSYGYNLADSVHSTWSAIPSTISGNQNKLWPIHPTPDTSDEGGLLQSERLHVLFSFWL